MLYEGGASVGTLAEMEVYARAEMGDSVATSILVYGDWLIDGLNRAYPPPRLLLYDPAGRLVLVTRGDR